ncbi:uncharacterized protein [Macrobrachium rosenbergii]|uniref:uncharacterized protein n=1 Tax=Macrobrachium rosenbergii TaxID=79674 RepID=UPI0034D501D3
MEAAGGAAGGPFCLGAEEGAAHWSNSFAQDEGHKAAGGAAGGPLSWTSSGHKAAGGAAGGPLSWCRGRSSSLVKFHLLQDEGHKAAGGPVGGPLSGAEEGAAHWSNSFCPGRRDTRQLAGADGGPLSWTKGHKGSWWAAGGHCPGAEDGDETHWSKFLLPKDQGHKAAGGAAGGPLSWCRRRETEIRQLIGWKAAGGSCWKSSPSADAGKSTSFVNSFCPEQGWKAAGGAAGGSFCLGAEDGDKKRHLIGQVPSAQEKDGRQLVQGCWRSLCLSAEEGDKMGCSFVKFFCPGTKDTKAAGGAAGGPFVLVQRMEMRSSSLVKFICPRTKDTKAAAGVLEVLCLGQGWKAAGEAAGGSLFLVQRRMEMRELLIGRTPPGRTQGWKAAGGAAGSPCPGAEDGDEMSSSLVKTPSGQNKH